MIKTVDSSPAWVIEAVRSLRLVDSWTGRIHVHKLLFISQILGLAAVPFNFELYQYGPYSFQLDSVIAELESDGLLSKQYPRAGYGPRYAVTAAVKSAMRAADVKALGSAARELKSQNSSDLELIATCLWVERREKVGDDEKVVARVKQIKPRYLEAEIDEKLATARAIASRLTK
jgi:uncharacterized protein YwgA